MTIKKFTRREALKSIGLATAASFLLGSLPWRAFGRSRPEKSRVVLIRDRDLLDESGNIRRSVLEKMFDRAVLELSGANDIQTAWSGIVKPQDVLGIKSNVWSHLPTPSALEQIIKERAMGSGVEESNISIDDRGVLDNPVFKKATALINARPMRTHDWSGVGSLIKNYIMFHPKPYEYHPDNCADLAKLWEKPMVKGKTRLNILVMVTPQFHGVGPHHFNKKYTWRYNGLIVSFDPVAADATGLRIIQARRREYFGDERPISPPAKHIRLADTRHRLGNASPDGIELVKLGWQNGILI
jgi:citrate lyase gamma subunit